MAFNFNWSPLVANTAEIRTLLTTSLNKSPKPPIIVSTIVVNELNLGSTPPSLEILEVGDLAEDRFRGIFKVRYEGDAYLKIGTKVQANPLRTFFDGRNEWVRPGAVAADSGLTIPLQITLSDIRLSGFVILVFSKQKGITLVFRNDPLESLKVSSTFDSIPFVRDYLQRTIEAQLRVLFMEDLPAIIHRLSLRVFNEEYKDVDEEKVAKTAQDTEQPVDPFASSSDTGEASPFFLGSQTEAYASFSQTSLLRLAALGESQRTLSLFTPTIRDTVYRAWATNHDRSTFSPPNITTAPTQARPATLSRMQSMLNLADVTDSRPVGALSSAASHTSEAHSHASRPSLASMTYSSMSTNYTLGSGRPRAHGGRKRKNRVVNLRRNATQDGTDDGASVSAGSSYEDSASRSESARNTGSTGLGSPLELSTVPTTVPPSSLHGKEREGEVQTPRSSPKKKVVFRREEDDATAGVRDSSGTATLRPRRPTTPRHQSFPAFEDADPTPRQSMYLPEKLAPSSAPQLQQDQRPKPPQRTQTENSTHPAQPPPPPKRSASELSISDLVSAFPAQGGGSSGGILEQAWMTKMATEIAKRVAVEKGKRNGGEWEGAGGEEGEEAPPAYGL